MKEQILLKGVLASPADELGQWARSATIISREALDESQRERKRAWARAPLQEEFNRELTICDSWPAHGRIIARNNVANEPTSGGRDADLEGVNSK
jgi:hypothetical protein